MGYDEVYDNKNKLFRKGLCFALSAAMMIGLLYVSDSADAANLQE